MEQNEPNTELMAAVSFTSDDLAANRLGVLTERQKQKMELDFETVANFGRKIVISLWGVAFLLLFVVIAVGVPEQLFSRGTKPAMPGDQLKWAFVGFFAIGLISAVFSSVVVLIAQKGRSNAKLDLPVLNAKGIMESPYSEYGHTLRIGEREFIFAEADDPVYTVFEPGNAYSVYYVFNTSHIIVSAEQIKSDI